MVLSYFCLQHLAGTRAFFKGVGLLLLCLTYSTSALGQNNFIAQVTDQKLEAFKQYMSTENGDISQIINLDASHLVGFHGDQGLKAKVRRFEGVLLVSDNPEVQWIDPSKTILLGVSESDLGTTENAAEGTKNLAGLQWGMHTIQVEEAWKQSKGKGVRIAIIDNGIDADHQDLKANVNTALSKSFVPTEDWEVQQDFGFNHGTHIAGIIAANDDQQGTHGIAPEAELLALKVASEKTGSGDFSWLLEAIVYAADQQVDIANVGLGRLFTKEGPQGMRAQEMKQMIEVTASYANKKGVTLIAPAGDDNKNIDDCCLYFPAHAEPFLTVSATAPVGWAFDPDVNPEKPTSYSNFGVSTVDFAAPGGDILYPGRDYCVKAGMNRPCWAFDLVFSTIANGWGWASGSSMSTAFLTGVAALVHSKEEEEVTPELMKLLLIGHARQRGNDPGNDEFYGFGITNAFAENHEIAHEHTTIEIIDGMLRDTKSEHVSPRSFELYQNYPNPFNPQTTINFHIPQAARVQVSVFDLMGSQVATLVDQELDTGCYNTSWNGRDEDGRTLTSGVYMYKIDAESFVDAKVMTFANN